MKARFLTLFYSLVICAAVYYAIWQPSHLFKEAQAQSSAFPAQRADGLEVKIYDTPKSFHENYVSILSNLLISNDALRYPDPVSNISVIADSTPAMGNDRDRVEGHDLRTKPIQFDARKNILIVLAAPSEHDRIKDFLDKLSDIKIQEKRVMFRVALLIRNISPQLKDYPFEINIKEKKWRDIPAPNSYPEWIDELSQRFPNQFFAEIGSNYRKHDPKFTIRIFASTKSAAQEIVKTAKRSIPSGPEIEIVEHDFMKESHDNLNRVLSNIFPKSKIEDIIKSLQRTHVYQVEPESILASESSIPGFFYTDLGDGYSVRVNCPNGVRAEGNFLTEIHVFKKDDMNVRTDANNPVDLNPEPFHEDTNLQLSTSLIAHFGQINMIGIRHHSWRYVLLFSIEERDS